MANLANKLGQTIQGKVNEFGSGFKSALTSGNPAVFGSIERALANQAKEVKKDREERKRERQFDEENQAEQRKLDTDILKSLKSIQKMLEGFISKKQKSFFDNLKEMLAPLYLILNAFMRMRPIVTAIVAGLISLSDGLSDFVKMFAGWTKQLGGVFADLFKNFKFVNFLEKLSAGLGTWVDDVLKAARGKIAAISFVFFEKFVSFFDDVAKGIKNFFSGSLFTRLAKLFDVELDFIKNFKMPEGWAKVKELFNAGITKLVSFFDEIVKLPIFEQIGNALGKFGKALPIIGNIIMVIEGFFSAFDTEEIAKTLGKQIDEVGFKDRISAFFGGLVGSIFGIFDLIGTIVGAVFGLEEGEGESIQKQATRIATQFVDGILKAVEGLGRFIIGLLTGDMGGMGKALGDMGTAIVDSFGIVLATLVNTVIDGVNSLLDFFGQSDKKLSKFSTFTTKQNQIATAKQTVVARGQSDSSVEWDKMYGAMYNQDGSLKNEYVKQQEELLKRATAEGFYEALKRPGSLSVSEALNIQANLAEDEAINGEKRWQETQQYEQERAGYYRNFQATLESGFKDMIDGLADMGSTEGGAGRKFGEKLVGGTFDKLGKKIFGKETGGQVGEIFTQLFGSYTDQIVSQTIGPALFGSDTKQANRFFNSLASGNKKNATEDLLAGMFGINTGMRSALGYEEGAAQLAKDLAEVTGAPFAGLFGVDAGGGGTSQADSLNKTVTDPIVDATYGAADRIIDQMNGISKEQRDEMIREQNRFKSATASEIGGGSTLIDASGNVRSQRRISRPSYFGDTAGGRIMDTGLRMGQAALTSKIAGDNPFAQAIVGSLVGDLTSATVGGGQFDIVQSIAGAMGVKLPPGASLTDLGMGLYGALSGSITGSMATSVYNMGTAMGGAASTFGGAMQGFGQGMAASGSWSGFTSTLASGSASQIAGMAAGMFGQAMLGNSLNKMISGEYSISKGFDTAVMIASAIPGIGPIAGVIGGVLNRAFGMGKKRITGQGITGTLGEDSSSMQQYATWHQKGGWFRSSRSGVNYSALDPEFIEEMTQAAKSITTGVRMTARMMGLGRLPNRGPTGTFGLLTRGGTGQYNFDPNTGDYVEATAPVSMSLGGFYDPFTLMKKFGISKAPKAAIQATDNYRNFTAYEQNLIKNMQVGQFGRLQAPSWDQTPIFKLVQANVQKTGGLFNLKKGEVVSEAVLQFYETANDAYAEAFQKLQQSFSQAVHTSGYDMETVLIKFGNDFIRNSFGNLIDIYQKSGEELFETFDRLTTALVNYDEAMLKLGYSLVDMMKAGYDAFDIFAGANVRDAFISLYGGMEKFTSQTERFFDLFYTQEEKLAYYEDVGKRRLAEGLQEVGLDATMTVDNILSGSGDNMEEARINYRKMVDDFVETNKHLLAANDPKTIEQLAMLQGQLAESYYVTVQSMQELDRISDTSKETLEVAARRLFEADRNKFALGGIATGPESGYGATLHGTEAVIPLPNGREIPVMLKNAGAGTTIVNNNIVGNGNAAVNSNPTNVFSSSPNATSGSSPNRVLSSAY